MFTDEFNDDDLISFTSDAGLSINLSEDRVSVFRHTLNGWIARSFKISDVRSFTEKVMTPGQYATYNQGGGASLNRAAEAVGEGIGAAIQGSFDKSKARKNTGIQLDLRSTDLPHFFLNVPNQTERDSLLEALRQALSDGVMNEPFGEVPDAVARALERPSEEQLQKELQHQARQAQQQTADTQEFLNQQSAAVPTSNQGKSSLKTIVLSVLFGLLVFMLLALIF